MNRFLIIIVSILLAASVLGIAYAGFVQTFSADSCEASIQTNIEGESYNITNCKIFLKTFNDSDTIAIKAYDPQNFSNLWSGLIEFQLEKYNLANEKWTADKVSNYASQTECSIEDYNVCWYSTYETKQGNNFEQYIFLNDNQPAKFKIQININRSGEYRLKFRMMNLPNRNENDWVEKTFRGYWKNSPLIYDYGDILDYDTSSILNESEKIYYQYSYLGNLLQFDYVEIDPLLSISSVSGTMGSIVKFNTPFVYYMKTANEVYEKHYNSSLNAWAGERDTTFRAEQFGAGIQSFMIQNSIAGVFAISSINASRWSNFPLASGFINNFTYIPNNHEISIRQSQPFDSIEFNGTVIFAIHEHNTSVPQNNSLMWWDISNSIFQKTNITYDADDNHITLMIQNNSLIALFQNSTIISTNNISIKKFGSSMNLLTENFVVQSNNMTSGSYRMTPKLCSGKFNDNLVGFFRDRENASNSAIQLNYSLSAIKNISETEYIRNKIKVWPWGDLSGPRGDSGAPNGGSTMFGCIFTNVSQEYWFYGFVYDASNTDTWYMQKIVTDENLIFLAESNLTAGITGSPSQAPTIPSKPILWNNTVYVGFWVPANNSVNIWSEPTTADITVFVNESVSLVYAKNGTSVTITVSVTRNNNNIINEVLAEINSTNYTMFLQSSNTYNLTLNISSVNFTEGNKTIIFYANSFDDSTYVQDSTTKNLVVDFLPPSALLFNRTEIVGLLLPAQVNLTGNISDLNYNSSLNMQIFLVNSHIATYNFSGNSSFSLNFSSVNVTAHGTYYRVRLNVSDVAGNTNSSEINVTIGNITWLDNPAASLDYINEQGAWGNESAIGVWSEINLTITYTMNITAEGILANRSKALNTSLTNHFVNYTSYFVMNSSGDAISYTEIFPWIIFNSDSMQTDSLHTFRFNTTSVSANISRQSQSSSIYRWLTYSPLNDSNSFYIKVQYPISMQFDKLRFHPRVWRCTTGVTITYGCNTWSAPVDITESNNGNNEIGGFESDYYIFPSDIVSEFRYRARHSSLGLIEVAIVAGAFTGSGGGDSNSQGGGGGGDLVAICGNRICEAEETLLSCPIDCVFPVEEKLCPVGFYFDSSQLAESACQPEIIPIAQLENKLFAPLSNLPFGLPLSPFHLIVIIGGIIALFGTKGKINKKR